MSTEELVVLLRATDPAPILERAESRELRRVLGVLLVWIAEHEDLLGFIRAEAARRWSTDPSRRVA